MKVKAPAEKNFRRASVKPVKKKGGGRQVSRRLILAGVLAGLGLYVAYRATDLVLTASVLQVQTIAVNGNIRLSDGEVQALIAGLQGENILTASLDRYRERLLESPWVADAALRRVLPGTVEVVVSERRPIGLCRVNGDLYLLGRDGTILDEYGPQYAEYDLPIIDGVLRKQPRGQPIIDERRTELAARVIEDVTEQAALASRLSQVDVSDLHDAVVLLEGDTALLHVGTEKFAARLQGYVEMAEALRARVSEMDYVDLRFDGRIFVRPTGSAVVQVAGPPPVER
jgi:cell division protein FtsQ